MTKVDGDEKRRELARGIVLALRGNDNPGLTALLNEVERRLKSIKDPSLNEKNWPLKKAHAAGRRDELQGILDFHKQMSNAVILEDGRVLSQESYARLESEAKKSLSERKRRNII